MDLDIYKAKPNKSIREHNKDLIKCAKDLNKLGYLSDRNYSLLVLSIMYHDLGKVNPEFQKRVSSNKKIIFNSDEEVPHNVLSMFFVDKDSVEAEMHKFDKAEADPYISVLFAVAMHHDYGNIYKLLREKKELINKLLAGFDGLYKIKERTIRNLAKVSLSDIEAIKTKGYLNICDYAASAERVVEYKNDFLEQRLEEYMREWNKNQLQLFCESNKDNNIIAVAQTGMGKTEASLLWLGNNKGFFFLPVRTAINVMYNRLAKEVLNVDILNNEQIALLHSDAIETLLLENNNRTPVDNELISEEEVVEQGLKAQELAMPITVSTIDQLFDFVFKYNGFEKKLVTMSYSKIVIDEIQMYGPEVLAYLIYGLEKVSEYGGKIAIITATLMPFVKELLQENINFKFNEFVEEDSVRHNIKAIEDYLTSEDIIKLYSYNKKTSVSNKIIVICNTVKKAQEIYLELSEQIDNNELNLFHSRFTKEDREEKERKICECGKCEEVRNEIWVTTSVVEASLDIDFDYLFTELQDISSLFQRLGRCNRKGLKPVNNFNCYVYTEMNRNTKKEKQEDIIYHLSKELLCREGKCFIGLLSEQEKMQWINSTFKSDVINARDASFMKTYNDTYHNVSGYDLYELAKKDSDLRNILSVDIIPSPIYIEYQDAIHSLKEEIKKCSNKIHKISLIASMKKYLVSVPLFNYDNYIKNSNSNNGRATTYPNIKLSNTIEFKIMECEYDADLGFRVMNFKEKKIETNIF